MANGEGQETKSLFRDINADDDDPEIMEMESLCVNCEEQGKTRLFLTKIPFFREVIVSSFNCEHCSFTNSELQPAGRIQEKGVRYKVKVMNERDLNRQVVQTSYASVSIPEVDFESPPNKGCMTTVEGIIDRVVEGLSQDQVLRRIQHPEVAAQIDAYVEKLKDLKSCKSPFHVIVEDPSGNSFIENPHAPTEDHQLSVAHFKRSAMQQEALGLQPELEPEEEEKFNAKDEVLSFPGNCSKCNHPCPMNMKLIDIPHFKEVVLMAISCDNCGLKDSEVKGGAGIEPQGKKITLKITDPSDLTRDVLKVEFVSDGLGPGVRHLAQMTSLPDRFRQGLTHQGLENKSNNVTLSGDMCTLSIPELEFSTEMTHSCGRFTTLEGLMDDLIDNLTRFNPFLPRDSDGDAQRTKMNEFSENLMKVKKGELLGVHIIMDDPTGNSYLQNLYAPDPDPEMVVKLYDRTEEQDSDLGISDMKVENYENS